MTTRMIDEVLTEPQRLAIITEHTNFESREKITLLFLFLALPKLPCNNNH